MKKTLAVLMALLMLFSVCLVGCGNDEDESSEISCSTIETSSSESSSSEAESSSSEESSSSSQEQNSSSSEESSSEDPPVTPLPDEGDDTIKPSVTLKESVDALLTSKKKITFDKDGKFKALILADVHAGGTLPENVQQNIKTLIDRENPQLVIFTGDNAICSSEAQLRLALDSMVGYIEEKQIPWCHVYGNHDHEGGLSKSKMQEIYESYEWCVSKAGEDLSGHGNYALPVYNSDNEVGFVVWCLDSGSYLSGTGSELKLSESGYADRGYDYIKPDQINWYYNSSVLLEEYFGDKVNSIMAFHIPLQECYYAWQNREKITAWDGTKQEDICASAVNSGLFTALVHRGDVKAVVTGHDHTNDFMLHTSGIKLCASPNVSDTTYTSATQQGGRVFEVNQDATSLVKTYVSYIIEREIVNTDDYNPIANKAPISNFEGNGNFDITSRFLDSANTDGTFVGQVVTGKGVSGSSALEVGRTQYFKDTAKDNSEILWKIDKAGLVGDNKYLIVWMDLTDVSFRKASFGLTVKGQTKAFRTDDNDYTECLFYYLADGSTTWQAMSHGWDGCFGSNQNSDVAGMKGYFAFPLEDMKQASSGKFINGSSVIDGIYFYYSYTDENYANKMFYIDDVRLAKNYETFTPAQ